MNRRHWLKNTLLGSAAIGYGESANLQEAQGNGLRFGNFLVEVQVVGSAATAWTLTAAEGRTYNFAPPVFELNGTPVTAALEDIQADPKPRQFGNGVTETRFSGRLVNEPALSLEMVFRLSPDNPVVRFRYVLHAGPEHKLTASRKKDQNLCYLRCSLAALPDVREVRASVFNDLLHSYTLSESSIPGAWFANSVAAMGPLLVGADAQGHTLVLAYEHGSESPDAFLQFELAADRSVSLVAVKGNYRPLVTKRCGWKQERHQAGPTKWPSISGPLCCAI
jgi:alpha-galactosidase